MSRQIYEVVAGPLPTSLTAPFMYGVDTSIHVIDATDIPDAPNIITISDVDDYFVTLEYSTKNGTELTDLLYVEGQCEHEFSIGSEVVRAVAKYDFDALKEAVAPFDIVIEGNILPKVDAKVTIPPASEGHLGLVKPGQNVTISTDGTISATGGSGTGDYEDLENKPKINSVELSGNKSSSDLGLASASALQSHIADTSNPHSVTKAQVGLENVDNTSDASKPISTATAIALNLKADLADVAGLEAEIEAVQTSLGGHITNVSNPHAVTKTQVGLGNVDNTSDANKPVSTAVQAALDEKVDIVAGKGLSTNDFTDGYKDAVDDTESGLAAHIVDANNPHSVTAEQVGVESGAQVNVIEGIRINGTDVSLIDKKANIPAASTSGLGLIKVGANLSIAADGTLSATGGELSQIPSDWAQTDSTQPDFIKNKPVLGTAAAKNVGTGSDNVILGNDSRLTDSRAPTAHASSHVSGTDAISTATTSANGLMSSTDKSKLDGIEEQAQKNVKPDWNASSGSAQILNKPTAVSAFTNDSGYQTITQVTGSITTHNISTSAHTDIRSSISTETSRAEGEEQSLQNQIDALASRTDVVDVVATYADLVRDKYLVNDIVKVMQDETRGNAISYYKAIEFGTVKLWDYVGSQGPYYTKSEADGYFVPQQRTVNGYSLTSNVTLDADDVNALPYDTTLADLTGDTTHRVVTDSQIEFWNAKQAALTFDSTPTESSTNPVTSGGVYTALSGKASSSDLQSHATNTSNPHSVTKAQVGLGNVDNTSDADKPISTLTQAALDEKVDAETGKGLSSNDFTTTLKNKLDGIEAGAQVNVKSDWSATSGSAQEILNKPTALSSFTNDSGYQTSTQVANSITSHNLNGSAHQDIRYQIYDKEPAFDKNTAFNKNFGTESGTVCEGNDSRLSDARAPTAHVSTHKSGGADALYSTTTSYLTTTGWFYGNQTIVVGGVTPTNTVIVGPAPDSIDKWVETGCKCTRQSSNTLTFECKETPTTNITVNIMVML